MHVLVLAACGRDTEPPVLRLEGSTEVVVRAGVPLALDLVVEDPDTDPDDLSVAVTGDLEGTGTVRADRTVAFDLAPPAGEHAITVTASDPRDHTDTLDLVLTAVVEDGDGDGAAHPAWGGDDCDDADPIRYPGAPEVCDGRDQDCDDAVDEDAVDALTAFPDADGDGYGDDAGATSACDLTGLVTRGGDCDDGDRRVREGQTVVGRAGCGAFGPALEWLGEAPGDRAGDNVVGAGDLDGDGAGDVVVAAVEAAGGAGAVYVVGAGPPGTASLADAPARMVGAAVGDDAGYDVAGLPDRDGDLRDELLVGAPGAGAVYLVAGAASGALPDLAVLLLQGEVGSGFGTVAVAGDLDGDGLADLLAGSVAGDGFVAAVSGTLAGVHAVADVALATFVGEPATEAGDPASAGDLDGDGLGDVVIGAQADATGGADAGAVYVVYAPLPSGTIDLAGADAKWMGAAGSIAGHASDGLGDVDGDGRDDLAIGAPYDDPNGAKSGSVFVVLGPGPAGPMPLPTIADAKLEGDREGIRAGFSVSRAYDVDLDGVPDLAIGAKFDDVAGTDAGSVVLVTGPFAGTTSLADAAFKLLGQAAGDLFGDVGAAPDLDGDGRPELLVGARYHAEAGPDAGAAYVVFGADF